MEGKQIRIHISSFHLVKGISMIIVILGHMAYFYDMERITPIFWGLKFFGSPLMPIFFIISGFGFKEKSIKKTLKTTFNSLIVPYIWVMVAFVVVYPIANYIGYGSWEWAAEVTFRYLLAFLLGVPKAGHVIGGYEVLHCSAVWFFLASFVALNLLNLIIKVRKPVYQIVLVAICILIGYFLVLRDINYYCIPQGLMAVGSCYIGYLIKKYKLIERWTTSIYLYIVLIPIFLAHGIWGHMNLCLGEFRYGLWDYFAAICSALLLIAAALNLEQFEGKILDGIRKIGVYSYWILCIHSVEDGCMQWELFINAMPNQYVAFAGEIVLKAIIISSGCVVLRKISKNKYRRRMLRNGK